MSLYSDYSLFLPDQGITSSTPWPGPCYIIRSAGSARVITLQDGRVTLSPPDGSHRGCIYWNCVESDGRVGFKTPVAGTYLGHDSSGNLRCSAKRHFGWEQFSVRARPEGGFVLLSRHYNSLWPVGVKDKDGGGGGGGEAMELAKFDGSAEQGMVWGFIKVA